MTEDRQFPEGSRVDDLDLSGVRLHGANFSRAKITDAQFSGADVSADIDGLRINGVEIEPLVRAELDRCYPERVMLRATDLEGMREAWSMLEGHWAETVQRASRLPTALQTRRVDGEWSFVDTLRHLIIATECWLFRAVMLVEYPYHPLGLPWSGAPSEWERTLGLDPSATPDLTEVLPIRQAHQQSVRTALGDLTDGDLADIRTAPDTPGYPNGEHSVLQCLHVILNEEWEHHRYAVRDLEVLETSV